MTGLGWEIDETVEMPPPLLGMENVSVVWPCSVCESESARSAEKVAEKEAGKRGESKMACMRFMDGGDA